MKYLGLWSPGLRNIFWKICKSLRPASPLPRSYMFNVRSLKSVTDFVVGLIDLHVCCIWATQEHCLQATLKQSQKSSHGGLYIVFLPLFLHVCVFCFTLHFSLHVNAQHTKYYMKVC